MTEQSGNIHKFRHRSDTQLRVAAEQFNRLDAADRAALRPYVERLMAAAEAHLMTEERDDTRGFNKGAFAG